MAKCPNCKNPVSEPYKTWDMTPKRRQASEGKKFPTVRISLFSCVCGTKFRTAERIA